MNFVYSDFESTLRITDSGNVKVLYDDDVIIQSIRHIIATMKGERVRTDFGSSLIRVLFEPMTEYTTETIRRLLFEGIRTYEPRVSIKTILVSPNYRNGSYSISMELVIREIDKLIVYDTMLKNFS